MQKHTITLTVNGIPRQLDVASNELLLNVIRDRLFLTGAKYGCGIGECGGCTVLVDGVPTLACLTLAVAVDGASILTVEGIANEDGSLHPLQEAFIKEGAIQCGFCTPGMVILAKAFLDDNPKPTQQEIREHMSGNICRCTGYTSIIRAVQRSVGSRSGSNDTSKDHMA
jgi:carbon-monoxide dehydrogenase small subunit